MTDTYPMPEDGWVCFHCGERYTTPGAARQHFGDSPTARPACSITAVEFRAELTEYRGLEATFGILDQRNRKVWAAARERMRRLKAQGRLQGDG